MSLDRIVRFNRKHPRPRRQTIRLFLEDFVGAAAEVGWLQDQERFYIDFAGKPSHPLQRCDPEALGLTKALSESIKTGALLHDRRWIEVWLGRNVVYVMTRFQDPFVNAIAKEMAKLLAHYWQGKHESED